MAGKRRLQPLEPVEDLVVGHEMIDPASLVPHLLNFRTHNAVREVEPRGRAQVAHTSWVRT